MAGFSYLGLLTLWSTQVRPHTIPPRPATLDRFWEAIAITAALVGALAALVVTYTTAPNVPLDMTGPIRRPAATIASLTAVVGFSQLSAPESFPETPRWVTGPIATVLQHAAFVILTLNVLFLGVFFAFPSTSPVILAIFLTALFLAVSSEYGGVIWERIRPHPTPNAGNASPDPPVTVVIAAYNEAASLPMSLEHNLDKLSNIPFILVPAQKSNDGTIAIADQFADEYPERVTVIEGTTGAKGTDLNEAWDHVETPYAIVLDADERVDEKFLALGLEVLESRPQVGVVQGRKAAIQPFSTLFNRFVTTERRQSTMIDQPFFEEVFQAGHFAGSAAIFRTEVPPSVGGWRPTYTEDIDITVRIDLETDWLINVVPEMIVYEEGPINLRALIAQRERWSRGWAEVAVRYIREIFRTRQRFGLRRTFGLIWILFMGISSPIFVIFPALMAVRGLSLGVPPSLGVVLALLILPARSISYVYAAIRDPVIPVPKNPLRILELVVFAYMWIPAGWIIQTHALFLQLAQADIGWQTTEKQSTGPID